MENTQLTLADLASIQSIIEASSTRGAFRANELANVGAVYNKLSAFLKVAQAQADASQADSESETPQAQGEQNA